MTDATPRFALPFILPGQAQKELFHNEAILLADALLHAAVEGAPQIEVPVDPTPGQCWIVAAAATGAWSGRDHALAIWTEGGWRFAAPIPGMAVWNKAEATWLIWSGTSWRSGEVPAAKLMIGGQQVVGPRQPAVPSPSGGTTIDAEARSALDALIVALRSHGLID
ncbi:MAG TPA: DUF2793 domain-containing protein [Allosphingosinicella sp.]|jgi:hypothetical protein